MRCSPLSTCPPRAAPGDEQQRSALLAQRLAHVVPALRIALREGDTRWAGRYLARQHFPEPGYRTREAAQAGAQ